MITYPQVGGLEGSYPQGAGLTGLSTGGDDLSTGG